jgi:DNA topoisomerase-1
MTTGSAIQPISMTKLLIVESPAKCSKIQSFLGSEWKVQATMGHIRALKEDLEGIGFKKEAATQIWTPIYESIASKSTAIANLRKAAKGAEVYLGSDDDREGEAIAWHTCAILGLNPTNTPRVVFREITKDALLKAVANPTKLNMDKFHAQQSRTMLDMLIGFTLSPCLWRGVGYKPGLSAGRCQTPALRIIYDRDRAIEAHVPTVLWKLTAETKEAVWKSAAYPSEEEAKEVLRSLTPTLCIQTRKESISTHQAPKPYITSTLQQDASSRLGMNPKTTMKIAQTLYEQGHITYMRTDNPVMSAEAQEEASSLVRSKWGEEYVSKVKVKGKVKDNSQEAHEAIRPTHMEVDTVEGQSLYTLIWKRAIQSVMSEHTEDVVQLTATCGKATVSTEWRQTRFAGWSILEPKNEETTVCSMKKGEELPWSMWAATESRTTPESRYTEAALIRDLEGKGIGRPSTYATLVETVLERGYVEKAKTAAQQVEFKQWILKAGTGMKEVVKKEKTGGEKDKLRTTPLGRTVIEWLVAKFGDIVDYDTTAKMEASLDEVAQGQQTWDALLTSTWSAYKDRYHQVMSSASSNQKVLGEGYKVVVGKKGPLFILEQEGQKTQFAQIPKNLSVDTVALTDAKAAFESLQSTEELDGHPVQRRSGKFGPYVLWNGHTLSCSVDEPLEELTPKLRAKLSDVDHTVGPYKIKKGPYGLYMFKPSPGSKTKPKFVGIPDTTVWATLTVEGADALYKAASSFKKVKN